MRFARSMACKKKFSRRRGGSIKCEFICRNGLSLPIFLAEQLADRVHDVFLPNVVAAEFAQTSRVGVFGDGLTVHHVDKAVSRVRAEKNRREQTEGRAGVPEKIYHVIAAEAGGAFAVDKIRAQTVI